MTLRKLQEFVKVRFKHSNFIINVRKDEVMKGTTKYGLRVTDVLEMYGVSPVVYYSWIRKGNDEPETRRVFIKIRSGVDLIKLSDKLKEIEEIEHVIFS